MKKILIAISLLFTTVNLAVAQEEQAKTYKGKVEVVNEVDCQAGIEENYVCFSYGVNIKELNKTVETMVSTLEQSSEAFKVGDSVYINNMKGLEEETTWSITGYDRGRSILLWTVLFLLLIFIIGGKKSLGSILSLILSFFIIYIFLIPQITSSANILVVGYITVFLILTLGMYLAHGFRKLTTISLISTFIGIGIVSFLSWILLNALNINGMGDESAFLLSSQLGEGVDIRTLFLFSIVLGATGVLDDVIIGQVSSMNEIYETDKKLTVNQLYQKTMNVGKEHVASMINTLFIVYAGSSLPLVVLIYLSNRDIGTLVSIDMISEEIVRTLAISTSLLLVVPISTYLSALFLNRESSSQ
jgi:uncharacterized membrane protein